MGHIHLGTLPGTKKWREVADLLGQGGTTPEIVMASAIAAERDLARGAKDPILIEAVRILAMLPQAATAEDFGARLRQVGIGVPDQPLLFDVTEAIGRALDTRTQPSSRPNDFTEIVRRALIATITQQVGGRLPSLFATEPDDVRAAVAKLARPSNFSGAAREFFSRLIGGSLAYYLSRSLSAHVGPEKLFTDASARSAFDAGLEQYCYEASRIIREFSAGWYGKTIFEAGQINRERAAVFAHVAFKKLREELQVKRGDE